MNKFIGLLFAIISFIGSIFIANQKGKKQGKEEVENKQNKEILEDVKRTQDRINKYNRTSNADIREFLRRKRENSKNK